jgi:sodium-dependent dicarboxylate transporter 2/3/5
MDTIQVFFFFVISYLLSRVFVMLKIPELIVYYLFEKKHVSIQKLTYILILGSALISTIIANVITVLTLMPLVVLLQKEIKSAEQFTRKMNTLLLLSVIWGANIGGIGMVTGTTTNGVLIGLYEMYKVPIAKDFTFISWAAWGLPLVLILSILGWLILMGIFKPGKQTHKPDFAEHLESSGLSRKMQQTGFVLAASFIVTASGLSLLLSILDKHKYIILFATIIWTLIYLHLLLIHKWKAENGTRKKLLEFKDTLQDIPKKGLLWIGIAVLVTIVLWKLNFHQVMATWFTGWLEGNHSLFLLYWIFALLTTFASEVVSNSAVQLTMFTVLFPMTKINPDLSWQGMLIVTLCSSCAFMTPLATPSNGLGFGSSSKVSLKYMMMAGFIMNIVCATLISVWVYFIVPITLRWFM